MYEEDKNIEISKRKAATTTLNALQQLFGRISVEKTPEQYSLNHHHSQKTREDAWWDIYSSEGLDDQQVYDRDGLKGNYIMWKTSHKRGIEKQRKRKEEKIYCSTKGCISPQTTFSSSFTSVSMFVLILNHC